MLNCLGIGLETLEHEHAMKLHAILDQEMYTIPLTEPDSEASAEQDVEAEASYVANADVSESSTISDASAALEIDGDDEPTPEEEEPTGDEHAEARN